MKLRSGRHGLALAVVAGALMLLPACSFAAGTAPAPSQASQPASSAHMTNSHSHMMNSSKKVESAQQALNTKANAQLKVDGVYGPKTREAVKSFQQSHGLKATGQLDQNTTKALEG